MPATWPFSPRVIVPVITPPPSAPVKPKVFVMLPPPTLLSWADMCVHEPTTAGAQLVLAPEKVLQVGFDPLAFPVIVRTVGPDDVEVAL